jgi:hypothetical protein
MKTLALASMFMPPPLLFVFFVAAGLLLIAGVRKPAYSLITLALAAAFSPILEPFADILFAVMPWWFAIACIATLIVMFAGRFLRDVAVHVTGDLVSAGLRALLFSRTGLAFLLATCAAFALFL